MSDQPSHSCPTLPISSPSSETYHNLQLAVTNYVPRPKAIASAPSLPVRAINGKVAFDLYRAFPELIAIDNHLAYATDEDQFSGQAVYRHPAPRPEVKKNETEKNAQGLTSGSPRELIRTSFPLKEFSPFKRATLGESAKLDAQRRSLSSLTIANSYKK